MRSPAKDEPEIPFVEVALNSVDQPTALKQDVSEKKEEVVKIEEIFKEEKNDGKKRVFEINTEFDVLEQPERSFPNNRVTTTTYTKCNFFPKNLMKQLLKVVNAYFVFLILLQLVPGVGQKNGAVFTCLPLIFVVFMSMIKDKIEDNKRRAQDDAENNQLVLAVPRGGQKFEQIRSEELDVGCLVRVMENQSFPADLIIVKSSLPRGVCYVETKNLDGETNMKQKLASEHIEKGMETTDTSIVATMTGN